MELCGTTRHCRVPDKLRRQSMTTWQPNPPYDESPTHLGLHDEESMAQEKPADEHVAERSERHAGFGAQPDARGGETAIGGDDGGRNAADGSLLDWRPRVAATTQEQEEVPLGRAAKGQRDFARTHNTRACGPAQHCALSREQRNQDDDGNRNAQQP